jgi:CheY-like chemotaxis protein
VLGNAVKFTPAGGWVRLRMRRDGEAVVIEISDSGRGIAPDLLRRIFEPFVQQDESISRTHSGLGLGLTITRRLVEMHGGTIEAHSAGEGHGSTFTLRLPLVPPPPAASDAAAAPGSPSRRVLVVDDNRDAADSLTLSLQLLGHVVRTAYDAAGALALGAEFHPEVVLLDIGMPGTNGYEAAARMRAQDWGAGATLVALTGFGQAEDRERARAAGFDRHLVKPAEMGALQDLLAASRLA